MLAQVRDVLEEEAQPVPMKTGSGTRVPILEALLSHVGIPGQGKKYVLILEVKT